MRQRCSHQEAGALRPAVMTRRGHDTAHRDRPGQLAPALGAAGPGRPLPRRGLVDRRHPRADGRRRARQHGPTSGSACAPRCGRGRARSPTSTGRPARSPPSCAPGAWVRAASSSSSSRTGSRPGITFWAAAYLGAVVVPIVHFYGAKEVELHRPGHRARRRRHRRPVRPRRPPGHVGRRAGAPPRPAVARRRATRRRATCRPRRRRSPSLLDAEPLAGPARRRPRRPGDRGVHVRHDPRPQGRRALAPHDRLRGPPARPLLPRRAARRRSPARRSATSSACSTPSSCRCCGCAPVNLDRRLGPGRGAAHDARGGARRRAGAPRTS